MEWKETKTDIQMPNHDDLDWVLTRLGKAEAENVQYYAAYMKARSDCTRWKIIAVIVGAIGLILQFIALWWKL